jgi:hypothetical protein
MFFPDPVWNLIKEYMLDELHDIKFMFREIARSKFPFPLNYEIGLYFYYQAKNKFAFFLQEWFKKTLELVSKEGQITLCNLERDPRPEWKLYYFKSLHERLIEKQTSISPNLNITELWKEIYRWKYEFPSWIELPIRLFLRKCQIQSYSSSDNSES